MKKERQHNDQMKEDKWKSNDIQNIYIKPNIENTNLKLKPGMNLGALEVQTGPAPHVLPVVLL